MYKTTIIKLFMRSSIEILIIHFRDMTAHKPKDKSPKP